MIFPGQWVDKGRRHVWDFDDYHKTQQEEFWHLGQMDMKALLVKCDLWGYANGTIVKPRNVVEAIAEWMKSYAFSFVLMNK